MLASTQLGPLGGPYGVALLHGFLGAGRNLGSLARAIQKRRADLSLLLPDLSGHGDSPAEGSPTLDNLSRQLASHLELVRPAPLAKPTLVGHSMGGRVAMALAAQDAGFGRVIVLDMGPGQPQSSVADKMVEDLGAAPASFETRSAAEEHFLELGHSPFIVQWLLMNLRRDGVGLAWKIRRPWLTALHASSSATSLWAAVEAGPERFSFLFGARSTLCSKEDKRRLRTLGAQVDELQDVGHFLHVEAREETARWLANQL